MKIKLIGILSVLIAIIIWALTLSNYHENNNQNTLNERIITTDWTTGETLVALSAPLVGIGDKAEYAVWVGSPSLSDAVADLGLRSQPNLEVIQQINPTIYISSEWTQGLIPKNIMPIRSEAIDFYPQGGINWENAVTNTYKLAKLVNREKQADELITKTQLSIDKNRRRITAHGVKLPIAVVQFIDSRHLRIYGTNSLYGAVLTQLGLQNVWHTSANAWGFDQISLLDLASLPDNSMLIIVKPYPTNIYKQLKKNTLWNTIHYSDAKQYRILPAVWGFGALPSMQRFSDVLTDALTDAIANPPLDISTSSLPNAKNSAKNDIINVMQNNW